MEIGYIHILGVLETCLAKKSYNSPITYSGVTLRWYLHREMIIATYNAFNIHMGI